MWSKMELFSDKNWY